MLATRAPIHRQEAPNNGTAAAIGADSTQQPDLSHASFSAALPRKNEHPDVTSDLGVYTRQLDSEFKSLAVNGVTGRERTTVTRSDDGSVTTYRFIEGVELFYEVVKNAGVTNLKDGKMPDAVFGETASGHREVIIRCNGATTTHFERVLEGSIVKHEWVHSSQRAANQDYRTPQSELEAYQAQFKYLKDNGYQVSIDSQTGRFFVASDRQDPQRVEVPSARDIERMISLTYRADVVSGKGGLGKGVNPLVRVGMAASNQAELRVQIGNRNMTARDAIDFINRTQGLYERLGVRSTAEKTEIKTVFQILMSAVHCDRHPDDIKSQAQSAMKRLNEARDTLTDSEKRREYDSKEKDAGDRSGGGANRRNRAPRNEGQADYRSTGGETEVRWDELLNQYEQELVRILQMGPTRENVLDWLRTKPRALLDRNGLIQISMVIENSMLAGILDSNQIATAIAEDSLIREGLKALLSRAFKLGTQEYTDQAHRLVSDLKKWNCWNKALDEAVPSEDTQETLIRSQVAVLIKQNPSCALFFNLKQDLTNLMSSWRFSAPFPTRDELKADSAVNAAMHDLIDDLITFVQQSRADQRGFDYLYTTTIDLKNLLKDTPLFIPDDLRESLKEAYVGALLRFKTGFIAQLQDQELAKYRPRVKKLGDALKALTRIFHEKR